MASRDIRTTCNQLIRRGIDLCRLYRHAALAVGEPGLRAVLGEEAGMAFARQRGIAALFISAQPQGYRETMTPALAAMLE